MVQRENIEWRAIQNYENQYEVSNYGDFHILPYHFIDKANRNITRKEKYIRAENLSSYGGTAEQGTYLGIHLGGMHKAYVHRIVAQAFCPNPEEKPEVNHKDGNTKNNYAGCLKNKYQDSNLEWVHRKENMEHASANGLINHESVLRKFQCKENRKKINYEIMKRPICQLTLSGELIAVFDSITEAAKTLQISAQNIIYVAQRREHRKSAGGYNWIYKEDYDPMKNYEVIIDKGASSRKPVVQKTLDGETVAEYDSIQEACKQTGYNGNSYISECCKGKRQSYKNFIWQYKN